MRRHACVWPGGSVWVSSAGGGGEERWGRAGGVQVLRTYGDYSLDCQVGPGQERASGNKRPPSAPKATEEEDPFRMILVLQKV